MICLSENGYQEPKKKKGGNISAIICMSQLNKKNNERKNYDNEINKVVIERHN